MIRIISGNPGSGKSYYAVNYLRKFCKFDKVYQTMNLEPYVLLITNIDEIKVPHISWDDFVKKDLFNIDHLRDYIELNHYRKVIIIIDECQRYFGNLRENEKFFFFEYHRHLGIDCFLILQTVAAIPKRLTELCEYIIRAKSRVYAIVGFQYSLVDPTNGDKISSIYLKKDLEVFKLYKSFNIDEDSKAKPKPILRNKIIITATAAIGVLIFMFWFPSTGGLFPDQKNKHTEMSKKDTPIKNVNNITNKDNNITDISKIPVNPNSITPEEIRIDKMTIVDKNLPMKADGNQIKGVANVGDKPYIFR
jgi:zona occludens toxin (predicted ATPase)